MKYDDSTKERAAMIAIEIEECLNSKFQDVKSYSDKARSLVFNLKDKKNPDLKENLVQSTISPYDLVTMEPKELASE